MPIYGYRCGTCGHEFEVLQKMSDAPLKTCPKCSGQLAKMVYAAGIVYKGSGYYSTDYTKGGKAAASTATSNGAKSDSDSSSGSDTKPAGESSTKPESKSESKTSESSSTE
jgi:putative FmdB family regulatory protein